MGNTSMRTSRERSPATDRDCKSIPTLLLLLGIFYSAPALLAQEFQLTASYSFGSYMWSQNSLVVGDFNEDGVPDIVIADEHGGNGGRIGILLGNGDGTFQRITYYGSGPEPLHVAVADFNHDGHLDLVTDSYQVSWVGQRLFVELGNGDGSFQPPVSFKAQGIIPTVADFNHDGNPDVLTLDGRYINVLLGNGDGTFQRPVTTVMSHQSLVGAVNVTVADFNNDGIMDAAVVTGVRQIFMLLGNGDGTFFPFLTSRGRGFLYLEVVAAGDFNHDGNVDLVAGDAGRKQIGVLLGNGDGTFQVPVLYPTGSLPNVVTIADFNGDGSLDIASTDYFEKAVVVFLGVGDGTFGTATDYSVTMPLWDIAVGDFNLDGRLDMVVGGGNGKLSILTNMGNGNIQHRSR